MEWKTLEKLKLNNYEVSEDGQIRNKTTGNILKNRFDKHGYKRNSFTIKREDERKIEHYFVHQLVASEFVDNPNGYKCVNHKDEDKLNNHYSNLEWCSRGYNNSYSKNVKNGGKGKGKKVINLGTKKVYKSMSEAGRDVGVRAGAIYNCCEGINNTCKGNVWMYFEDYAMIYSDFSIEQTA